MLRILWLSDRILGTSAYSKVTYECCTRLIKMGHKVAHVPMGKANLMGNWVYQGVLIYRSSHNDPFCEDVTPTYYADFHADMLIVLKDVWCIQHLHKLAIVFVPYVPVDHHPISPSITSRLHTAFRILTPSRFGQRELRNAGFEATYIPHGVRTDVFRPLDKTFCKKLFYIRDPDDFTVLIVAMNRSRKQIPRMLRVYKRFVECNPDVKTHLILWTNIHPSGSGLEGALGLGVADVGVNLLPEIVELGLGEHVIFPDPKVMREGLPDWAGPNGQDMVKLYNSADVLLMTTGGEGFGLPLLEAQATGTPVITTDYASAPELVASGLVVPASDYVILNTPGTRYALVDIDKGAEALTKIMNADPSKLARRARRFAERFDWNIVMEKYFKPFLEECETELKPLICREGVKSW